MRVAVAARTAGQAELVAQEIGGLALNADVSDEPAVARMVTDIESELGPIDLLVNNAGVASPSDTPPIWEERPGDWWRAFEINVLGSYQLRAYGTPTDPSESSCSVSPSGASLYSATC